MILGSNSMVVGRFWSKRTSSDGLGDPTFSPQGQIRAARPQSPEISGSLDQNNAKAIAPPEFTCP